MIRTTLAGTLLTGLLGGCATPTGPAPSHTPEPPVDAATAAGLDAESARRARWAGVLSDAPGEAVDITAVVATARAPVHALPSTSSRVLGTLKQSGEIPVEELLLWVDVSAEDSAATAFGDGRTPTWARIRIGDVVGFVPWSCLIAPDRYDARPPADVRFGAENDLLEVSRGRVASTGGIPWDEVLAADPDREAIDALVFATEPRFLPSGEPMEALPTEFVAATPADRFFFGREQAGRLLAAMSAAPPDAEVTARVRAIGDAVADSSRLPRPYAEWIWVVLDAPEILDCFAMPGGFVFVTTGLLDAVANDDELAAILGREVARLEAGVAMPAIGRALASRADDLRLRARGGDDAIGDADRWTDVTDTVVGIDEGPSPIAAVVDRSSIGLESRLDGRGVALAAAAGFDPWALTDLVVRMNERSLGVPGLRTAPEDALDLAARTAEIVRTRGDAVAEVESPDASDGVDDAPSAGSDAATDASAPASASASDVDSTGVDGADSVVDGETDGETEGGRDDRDGASDSEASSATNPPAEPGTAPEVD